MCFGVEMVTVMKRKWSKFGMVENLAKQIKSNNMLKGYHVIIKWVELFQEFKAGLTFKIT